MRGPGALLQLQLAPLDVEVVSAIGELLQLVEAVAGFLLAVDDAERRHEHRDPEHSHQLPPLRELHAATLSATRSTALRARGLAATSASPAITAPPTSLRRGRACGGTCGNSA